MELTEVGGDGDASATRDEGMVASGVIAVVAIGLIALLFFAILPLLSGTEQSGRTQTSADAAALAGAGEIRTVVLDELGTVIRASGGVPFRGLIRAARGYGVAQSYAGSNGADLSEYRYDPWSDEVTARTNLREVAPNGDHAESLATASLGVELGNCVFASDRVVIGFEPVPTPGPTPSPSVSPTPTPTPEPEPVPIYGDEYRFRCPGFDSGARGEPGEVLTAAHDWLDAQLRPSLLR